MASKRPSPQPAVHTNNMQHGGNSLLPFEWQARASTVAQAHEATVGDWVGPTFRTDRSQIKGASGLWHLRVLTLGHTCCNLAAH